MSEADIRVRIRENSKKAVAQIKKNFAKVDKSRLRAKLSVNDSEVDSAKAKLEALGRDQTTTVRARVSKSSIAKTKAQLASLGGFDAQYSMRGTRRAPSGIRGGNQGGTFDEFVRRPNEWVEHNPLYGEDKLMGSSAKENPLRKNTAGQPINSNGNFVSTGKEGRGVPSMDADSSRSSNSRSGGYQADPKLRAAKRGKEKFEEYAGSIKNSTKKMGKHRDKLTSLTGSIKAFGRNIGKFTPNIMMWWNLIGLLLPLMIALGVQAAGVAVAMGGIAVAGAGLIGLGLIGHGEGIADSFGLAKRQLNKFKRELFQTFKPALSEFAPISGEFMKKLPGRLEPIVDSLRGITVFEDSFISAFNGVVDFVAEGLDRMNESAAILDQLAHRFGGIVGDEIFGFLEFLTRFAYENQDAMIELGGVFKNALVTVWNLILVFAYMLAALKPLTSIIAWISDLLGNKMVAAIAIAAVTAYAFTTALIQTATALAAVQTLAGAGGVWALFAGFLTTVASYASAVTIVLWEMVTALSAIHYLTGGLALLAAGGIGIAAHNKLSTDADALDESNRRTSGNGGGPTTINNEFYVNGDGAKSAGRELQDKFPTLYDEQERKDSSQSGSGI